MKSRWARMALWLLALPSGVVAIWGACFLAYVVVRPMTLAPDRNHVLLAGAEFSTFIYPPALALSGVWAAFVAARLWRARRRTRGSGSLPPAV